MNFIEFAFIYIVRGYKRFGEKHSAHFYAMCVMALFVGLNIMSLFIIFIPNSGLSNPINKKIVLTFYCIPIFYFYYKFVLTDKYKKYESLYETKNLYKKVKWIILFWVYLLTSIFTLVFSILYHRNGSIT